MNIKSIQFIFIKVHNRNICISRGYILNTNIVNFTCKAYSKWNEYKLINIKTSNDIDEEYDAISESMLRLEIAVPRYRICALQRANDLDENIKILEAYAVISRSIFDEYIHRYFNNGDYYCYKAMCDMIIDSSLSDKRKGNMLLFAQQQVYCDSYRNARKCFIEKCCSKNQYYKVMEGFKRLNMSPMSLAYRDKHGDGCIPSLYYLLDI